VRSRADIEQWLMRAVARSLQVEASAIDRDRRFEEFGMDSVAAVELSGDLESWLGKPVAPTIVWDHPTIAMLAAALAV
jgi:acyl carrier protein